MDCMSPWCMDCQSVALVYVALVYANQLCVALVYGLSVALVYGLCITLI